MTVKLTGFCTRGRSIIDPPFVTRYNLKKRRPRAGLNCQPLDECRCTLAQATGIKSHNSRTR
ncbi:hypothetical protein PGT21_005448 [Puccinia graminis f. sp. tritici]|uniref:Uncharacterized protein n=1 Tax=Puccinia graminis f. sp. tritici TaxID=56615 RepID=A0A5B0NY64_PUCGR|nr:hypothetical protein PGT21_005448 [Puccinia graminis f. sp. tritici]KAA1093606.1 hypothetical protein PGTUg99_007441 [Puccinia graminis f. sp. tritici]